MAKETKIRLSVPVNLHGQPIGDVVLREPTGGDFIDLGDPRILARMADGTVFWVEDKVAVKGYLDRCVTHDAGSHLIRLLALDDVRRVKDALFGFFDIAETTSGASSTL